MDRFATLEPVRLYAPPTPPAGRSIFSKTAPGVPQTVLLPTIGRLPVDLHLLVLTYLPIPDIPSYARCSRATAGLARDERVWEPRWRTLGVEKHNFQPILDGLEEKANSKPKAPPAADDEFGEFADASSGSTFAQSLSFVNPSNPASQSKYQRAHKLLKPLTNPLAADMPPHTFLAQLAVPSVRLQSKTLHLLVLFLSPAIQALRTWKTQLGVLRAAIDRFDASLLSAFDRADEAGDESAMRDAAEASWELADDVAAGDWEMGKVWADKREVFYDQGTFNPLDNFTYVPLLHMYACRD